MGDNEVPTTNTAISYHPQKVIENPPPESRIDPPQIFTTFILILMVLFTVFLLYGLFVYLKVNFKQLPSSGLGVILNLALIALIVTNLVFLIKFWLSWNFITTVNNFFWLRIKF